MTASSCTNSSDPHRSVSAAVRASGLTQEAIGRRLGIGRTAVAQRMTGRTPWTLAEAIVLADLLGTPVADLLGTPQTRREPAPAEWRVVRTDSVRAPWIAVAPGCAARPHVTTKCRCRAFRDLLTARRYAEAQA